MVVVIYVLIEPCLAILALVLGIPELTPPTATAWNFLVFRKLHRSFIFMITNLRLLPVILLHPFFCPRVALSEFKAKITLNTRLLRLASRFPSSPRGRISPLWALLALSSHERQVVQIFIPQALKAPASLLIRNTVVADRALSR